MVLALYLAFLAAASAYALVDWRRAWLLVVICGAIQDPVRKVTPNTPVVISFAVTALYAMILFAARRSIAAHLGDFTRRFSRVYTALVVFVFLLLLAAVNGLMTFGFDKWQVPLLSFFTYAIPLLAVIFGYAWLQREEMMESFLRLYAVVTAVAMIGTVLEYLRFRLPVLGLVAFSGDYIRHLPGIQIRLLSGIYRSPDVMAWHAAMLTSISIGMALRTGRGRSMLFWGCLAGWGFFNCMLAGRRKAIYFVAVFALLFLWRYASRLRIPQGIALFGLLLLLGLVVRQVSSGERSVYARGALTTQQEIAQRLEGGALETFRQFGLMGAGLGTATQGVRHISGRNNLGWQEGGLGKLAVEVGLPGVATLVVIALMVLRLLLRLTAVGDVRGSSQFMRALLFALVIANGIAFMASAQAFTDAVLALTTGFLAGGLFATAALDERAAAAENAASRPQRLDAPVPA